MKQMIIPVRLLPALVAGSVCNRADTCGNYVVDQAAPGAADTNPGTEEKPFKTVQHAADVAKPGDTVFVMAGRYDERVKVTTSGAEGRPITLRAMPRRSAVVGGFDLEASYIRVEGFEITADKPAVAVQLGGSHCEVLDNYIHDMMVGVAGTRRQAEPPTASRATTRRWRTTASPTTRSITANTASFWAATTGWWRTTKSTACSCTRRATSTTTAITRGSSARAAWSGTTTITAAPQLGDQASPTWIASRRSRTTARSRRTCSSSTTPASTSTRCAWWRAPRTSAACGTGPSGATSPRPIRRRCSGGWGPDIIQTPDVTIENNTISTVKLVRHRPAGQGIHQRADPQQHPLRRRAGRRRRRQGFHARQAADRIQPDVQDCAARGRDEHQRQGSALRGCGQKRNFRLRKGSPAVGAGKGGATIGALEYPNVYYVDPRHPAAADEPAWGYPAVPLASLAKAWRWREPGETIVLRGGVYRETLRPRQRRRDGPRHEGREGDDQRGGPDRGLEARGRRQLVGAATVRDRRRSSATASRGPSSLMTRPPGGSW